MDDLGGEQLVKKVAGTKALSLGMRLMCSRVYGPGCRAHGPETSDLQDTLTSHWKPLVSVDQHKGGKLMWDESCPPKRHVEVPLYP